ncbi:hypothetical protein BYT27DRAFT_7076612 [Phlegmacium glaucopus]|nr:hypothetical protein BYT27DRAFT_7076612 [Phlegmacium glaucopus]
MIAATARARNPNWKGKEKSQRESKRCSNCKKKGHTDDNCFEKGGGKEHKAPDWWKEKKKKSQATKGKSANVASGKMTCALGCPEMSWGAPGSSGRSGQEVALGCKLPMYEKS